MRVAQEVMQMTVTTELVGPDQRDLFSPVFFLSSVGQMLLMLRSNDDVSGNSVTLTVGASGRASHLPGTTIVLLTLLPVCLHKPA